MNLHNSLKQSCDVYYYEVAQRVGVDNISAMAKELGMVLRVKNVLPIKTEEYPLPATRPAYSVFDKTKYQQSAGREIPDWKVSLKKYFAIRAN